MEYEWDKDKAVQNLRKHGVDFADAVIALEDDRALTIEDMSRNEQRFKTLGMGDNLKLLLVIHAELREKYIRIISARKATKRETKQYYEKTDYER